MLAAVSSIPQRAERFGAIAQEVGADIFVVQSTVSTVRHISSEYKTLDIAACDRDLALSANQTPNPPTTVTIVATPAPHDDIHQ